ncbi:tail fiber domain-containing protein [Sphingomonas sp. NY01]|uniref:tail fiber domain-containing protein n=1 Tax=Sphingomonas sp. NY01 TaxID=2968057 RepID=UPI00315C5208
MTYSVGTITLTNGSRVVTGAGTKFVANVLPGFLLIPVGGSAAVIAEVNSDTQLTLARPWVAATLNGTGYDIVETSGGDVDLSLRALAILNTFGAVRDTVGQGMFQDGGVGAPGFRFIADQDTGITRLAPNVLGLIVGAAVRMQIAPDITSIQDVVNIAGVAPSIYFSSNVAAWSVSTPANTNGISFVERQFGSEKLRLEAGGALRPGNDNGQTLGSGGFRWSVVYSGTGSINTSDKREKKDIGDIPAEWLDAWGDVQWQRFRFRDAVKAKGEEARWHLGLIAQQVQEAFAARGLDAREIGLLCHDEWEATPAVKEVRNEDGEIVTHAQPARKAGDRWGLRYDECQAIEAAWQRRRIGELEAAVAALQTMPDG